MIRRFTSSHRARRGRLVRAEPISYDQHALRRALGVDPTVYLMQQGRGRRNKAVLRSGTAKVNTGAMWKLMADKLYGSSVDAPAVATREALQNSRDAIDKAFKAGLIDKRGGVFEVESSRKWDDDAGDYRMTLTWRDNGVGMAPDVVFDKFLSLGDTTKTAGEDAGGFGIAKAIILGLSTTFRWRMHTQGYIYEANGFGEPVEMYEASSYRQGTELKVFEIDGKYNYWWQTSFGEPEFAERMRTVLASNNLAPRGRHAGIRLFYNGTEVQPLLRGRGTVLVRDAETEDKTKVNIRLYKRGDTEGRQYVRLDGLLQFSDTLPASAPFDLAIDISTRIAPGQDRYPLTAARTALDGETRYKVREFIDKIVDEALSATKAASDTIKRFGAAEGDEAEVEAGLRAAALRYKRMIEDPNIRKRLMLADGTGALLRQMQDQHRLAAMAYQAHIEEKAARQKADREAREEQDWLRRRDHDKPVDTPAPQRKRRSTGLSLEALGRVKVKAKKRRGGLKGNPFAGFAAIYVEEAEFNAARMRPYTRTPERWMDLAMVWQLTCQMVLNEAGRGHQKFDVGFVFRDNVRAMFSRSDSGRITLWLNPDWFSRTVMKAYKNRPLNVAAILHSKACHEIAHIEFGRHNESFISERESLADETASALYPIAGVVEGILGLRVAPTPEAIELAKLQKKLARSKKGRGRRNAQDPVRARMAQIRHRLVKG